MIQLLIPFLLAFSLLFNSFQADQPSPYNYSLIPDSSLVEWKGSTPKVTHQGSFSLGSQGIQVVDGQVVGGTFLIPIASIKNYDLPKAIKPVLLKHLKSKDFFHMALYPEATFTLKEVASLDSLEQGAIEGANKRVHGELTLLGKTLPVSFPARIHSLGDILSVEADFTIDRTKWGMSYGADPALGTRHIYPLVAIHLQVYASKN